MGYGPDMDDKDKRIEELEGNNSAMYNRVSELLKERDEFLNELQTKRRDCDVLWKSNKEKTEELHRLNSQLAKYAADEVTRLGQELGLETPTTAYATNDEASAVCKKLIKEYCLELGLLREPTIDGESHIPNADFTGDDLWARVRELQKPGAARRLVESHGMRVVTQEMLDLVWEKDSLRATLDSTDSDVKDLMEENAKLRAVVEAAQEVLNAELKVESYMNHVNKYIGSEIDNLGVALAALEGEG